MAIPALGAGRFGAFWLSGMVLAGAFVPVARFGPRGARAQFGVIAPVLLLVTALCTWSEALIFLPGYRQHAARDLTGSVVMYLIVSAGLAALAWTLQLTRPPTAKVERHSGATVLLMVLTCGAAYVIYYLVFGAITYRFFTRGYYPEATQIVARLGLWFWAIQAGRGLLMTLAVIPVIYTLPMKRWQAALAVGMLMWIAGGAAALLLPNDWMETRQRFIHIAEIFTQNASLGITAVLLLRPKPAPLATSLPARV
ncbi:MAG: hypothetical protein LAN84_14055 [Acidobacteriia bacterium]|nr:hypothetical protein [Terriglobia bacterium]